MSYEIYDELLFKTNDLNYCNEKHLLIIKPFKWNYILWCNYCGLGKIC